MCSTYTLRHIDKYRIYEINSLHYTIYTGLMGNY